MTQPLSAAAQRVMAAIAARKCFRRRNNLWSAEGIAAPESLVAELERRDLVQIVGDRLVLGEGGRAWAERRAGGPRLLAERSLPDDGEVRAGKGRARRRARSVTVNLAESPLGWLKARGLVDDRQYEAGERLRADWTIAGLGPRVTMRWDDAPRSRGSRGAPEPLDPTLAQIAAKQRMEAALDAVGSGLRDVAWRIVCAGEGMESAERALGWPARAGRVVLTLALDRLANFYRLP